jgi:Glyoxalase-like domain
MGTALQVTFDCEDPHAMARFWASAIGYDKEDHTELVANLLASAAISHEATVDADGGRQFAEVSACWDPEGKGPRLYFQKVPEGKIAKNRVHLDLHVGADLCEVEAPRLEAVGARKLWFSDDRGGPCWTMADIEGNEFCVD